MLLRSDLRRILATGVLSLIWTADAGAAACNGTSTFPPCFNPTDTDGGGNTAGGTNALAGAATGGSNTAFGFNALSSSTNTTTSNTAVGINALQLNSASFNTAVGQDALQNNTTGNNNNAVGAFAMQDNTTGANNNAQGINAMQHNTTGSNNVGVGSGALKNNISSNSNTAIGSQALLKSTGAKNIAIGSGAGLNLQTGDNNIYLASPGLASESNTIRIGTGAHARVFVAGIASSAVMNAASVSIDTATGQLGLVPSSARYKHDIRNLEGDARLAELRPVSFVYNSDKTNTRHYGLVAEEVAQVYPELVAHNAKGEAETVAYQALIPLLLKQSQQQQREIEALKAQVAKLASGHAAGR